MSSNGHVVTLTRWIETGRHAVTAGGIRRKAEVPAAGAALRVDVPARPWTLADIRVLHRAMSVRSCDSYSCRRCPMVTTWLP